MISKDITKCQIVSNGGGTLLTNNILSNKENKVFKYTKMEEYLSSDFWYIFYFDDS